MKILWFAWFRTRVGKAEEQVALPPEVSDVAGLLEFLRARSPGHAAALRDLSVVRVAVNQEYVPFHHPVRDGDEVALFPPVTGG
ncbi:MAG: molybdopterin converting factor subunit 1 [Alphaproteobacteria bacterium]|nr:molybdopterin converting factor subunit 1 [Alphaproteobacteria bacterium]